MPPHDRAFRVTAAQLNFRSAPEVRPGTRLAVLPQGQRVEKLADTPLPDWWRVATTLAAGVHARRTAGGRQRWRGGADLRAAARPGVAGPHLRRSAGDRRAPGAAARRGGEQPAAEPGGCQQRPLPNGGVVVAGLLP